MRAKDRIIVALDVDSLEKAEALVMALAPHVGCFKVGLELLTAVGAPKVVEFVHSLGGQIFYDGKLHDIPNTVAKAAKAIAGFKVRMFNVHASSGLDGMQAAVDNRGGSQVLAVTVLTSHEENNAHCIFGAPSKAKVIQFARDAKLAGCDGIVCSPQELTLLGKQKELAGLLKVTPGIRSPDDPKDDQNRTLSPREAILAGADYLVIGRPITAAADPVAAAKLIADEVFEGLKERFHMTLFGLTKIKFGAFRLKLHETNPTAPLSPIYLDIRKLPESAYVLAGDILHELSVRQGIVDFDYVIGIPKAGEPIGQAFAKAVGKPHLRVEKIEEAGGRHISTNILDPFEPGKRVVIVDDLVTKSHTKREAIRTVESNGLKVDATFVLYDREQGGLAELNAEGQKVVAASGLTGTLDFFVRQKKIDSAKKEEVLAYVAAN
ncbi:MAG TPA: orotidine-5'-phosphate decarboxylase [Candidatus Paceibacterota bacterium]